jgi:Lrp/AsnC family leucine-responsive transcriptional regulator
MQISPKLRIDEIDQSILSALQRNGKLSNVQLAQKIGLSESACLRRVKILEESNVMDRYVLLVDQSAIGIPGNVFVRVTLEGQQQDKLQAFERAIVNIEEVMECYLMSGDADYVLRVICKNNDDYKKVHTRLTNLPGVQRVHSSFALRTVIKKTELLVPITV